VMVLMDILIFGGSSDEGRVARLELDIKASRIAGGHFLRNEGMYDDSDTSRYKAVSRQRPDSRHAPQAVMALHVAVV